MKDRTMSMQTNRYLNAMRLIAALIVVCGHIRTSIYIDFSQVSHTFVATAIYALSALGNPAVMVFFALSGYWVGGPAARQVIAGTFNFRDYFSRRIVRLWLVLFPALLLTAILDFAGSAFFSTADIYSRPDIYAGIPDAPDHSILTFFGNILFLQEVKIPEFGYNKPLWSLALEFWYYMAFPLCMLAFSKKFSAGARVASAAGVVIAIAIGGEIFLKDASAWVIGTLLGIYPDKATALRQRLGENGRSVLRLFAPIVLFVVMAAARTKAEGTWYTVLALGLAAAFAIFAFGEDENKPAPTLSLLSHASECTYSLYAIHMPIVVILAAWLTPVHQNRMELMSWKAMILVVIVATLYVIAWIFARFTEQNTNQVRRWLSNRFFPKTSGNPTLDKGDIGVVPRL
ncbi:acyltransferase family protein [Novosphingobium sp. KACC 22771]|uniref:acyltransferase family protein n=1 Tax=Novosphingobium sp. KACC 22771 TaxID=3025670 RepID=UPI002366CDAE|nr:acyltransferase [Novosphingobium sp. KACC 22771]WDF72870.1 acyltransferase [Novosphingobium sp. KACC 22771]